MNRIDDWWGEGFPGRRIDREPYYLAAILSFWCIGLGLLIAGASPSSSISELPLVIQDVMAVMLFVGANLCLLGSIGGAPLPWISRLDRRDCYRLGILGAPLICSSLEVYGGAIVIGVNTWFLVLPAVLAPFLGAAALLKATVLWLEIRRLDHGVARRIADGDAR